MVTKVCSYCSKVFETNNNRKQYCSDKCRVTFHKKNSGTFKVLCSNCGMEFQTYHSNKNFCSVECRKSSKDTTTQAIRQKITYNRKCKECGKWFTTSLKANVFCNTDCHAKYYNRKAETDRRLRAYNNGKVDRGISIERLLQRDGDKCYLCDGKLNKNVHYNDDYYPSIEHIKPLSKGGTHTWDNVKLAHRKCNTLKSNKII